MLKKTIALAALSAAAFSGTASAAAARDYISIVGSSTVYPFATVVAEQFGRKTKFKTPKIESTSVEKSIASVVVAPGVIVTPRSSRGICRCSVSPP